MLTLGAWLGGSCDEPCPGCIRSFDSCELVYPCTADAQCEPGWRCRNGRCTKTSEPYCLTGCQRPCEADDACTEGVGDCAVGRCVFGCCEVIPLQCDDGNVCNGHEWCKGKCETTGPPDCGGCDVADPSCCDPETGCVSPVAGKPCASDADCPVDAVTCNRLEACDLTQGVCVATGVTAKGPDDDPCLGKWVCTLYSQGPDDPPNSPDWCIGRDTWCQPECQAECAAPDDDVCKGLPCAGGDAQCSAVTPP